jgi:excisionase family DNA binding protein
MDAQSILAGLPDGTDLIRPARIGALLDSSPAWVYARIKAGELRAVRVDGAIRVRRADLAAWLSEHVVEHVA